MQTRLKPELVENDYTYCLPDALPRETSLLQFRSRNAYFYLNNVELDSPTGPDGVSTILIRNTAASLCFAFALLARRIVETGRWPKSWKYHWLFPLFKRGVRSDCSNYRGLHLTSQLSKYMERFIGMHFGYRLSATFGNLSSRTKSFTVPATH